MKKKQSVFSKLSITVLPITLLSFSEMELIEIHKLHADIERVKPAMTLILNWIKKHLKSWIEVLNVEIFFLWDIFLSNQNFKNK